MITFFLCLKMIFIYKNNITVAKKEIVKAFIKLQVQRLMENQEPVNLDAHRIGKVDQYTQKLPLLDKSLRILLSPKYKHFVKDIQIVSPKPSTFKVVLNNDHFIYLIYNGGTISANIEGKTYSLITLDEAQRASKSVTELLKFSSASIMKKEVDGEGGEDLNSLEGGGFGSGGSASMDGEAPEGDDNGIPDNDGSEVGGTEDNPDFDIDAALGEK